MIVNRLGFEAILFAVLAITSLPNAATITVAQDGTGQYTSIQAAINRAQPGDVVQILDVATYKEQVTIDSTKNGLTLTSSSPTARNKPKIVWQDTVNVHPKNYLESQSEATINFHNNGALRILWARNITINGIAVDGGGPFAFGYPAVWNNKDDLLHGNAALVITVGGEAHIINCDLSNAYFGMYIKDRNQGGIFANANPADIQPQNIVPMSGFGKTGNHVFEYCRIHNNSYGMFFESSWDLGSTIRYNLFFENHHQSTAFENYVKKLTPQEGGNQPGGALFFKDVAYSPLAIYNNTFWHNFLIFVGGWRTGLQHLVFNNIYAKPNIYWQLDPVYSNDGYMEVSPFLPNRTYNCIYSIQQQAPQIQNGQITFALIINGLPQLQGGGQAIPPGSPLSSATANAAFPATANIRWLEMDSTMFLSMDPATNNFLEPKWTDTNVAKYIKNQGWQKSGVKNMDGSWADIGAISSDGGRPTDLALIRPADPVTLNNTTAIVKFSVNERVGRLQSPTMKLFRWISNLGTITPTAWSGTGGVIVTAANINDVTLPAAPPLQVGINTYSVTVPVAQTTDYAFFEGIIEGTDSKGKKYTTSTGFCPYRKLDYKFVVEVWNRAMTKKLDTVTVGDTVVLRVTPQKKDGTSFTNTVNPVDVSLASGFTLWNTELNPLGQLTYPAGITGVQNRAVEFTKVPDGGSEEISVSGIWKSTVDTSKIVFRGSADVRVLAGPPDKVLFQDPASLTRQLPATRVDPGIPDSGFFWVFDRFGNRVTQTVPVNLSSINPTVGGIVGGAITINTDATGVGHFQVEVTNGQENALFKIRAELTGKSPDTAQCIVGKTRDKLWIFFNDTLAYNTNDTLRGMVGERLKIVVMAGKIARLDSLLKATFTFSVDGVTPGLVFYSSPTATTAATSFTITNGRATIWVSSGSQIDDGSFMVRPDSFNTVRPSDTRSHIFFTKPKIAIDSAFYYADNGFGMVNRAEIYYKDSLLFPPDSVILYWPSKATGTRLVVPAGAQMTLAPDKKHLTIQLATPFPAVITAGSAVDRLGTTWDRPNTAPTNPAESADFAIADRVGPLLKSAQLYERFGAGNDTLVVTFSEPIVSSSLIGASLTLLKNGTPADLTVAAWTAVGGGYQVVVSGAAAPALGDSLRIKGGGPLTDSTVSKNTANANNRPVVITIKRKPVPIAAASYYDRNADGFVDNVVLKFQKSVQLSDCIVALDWGGTNKIDSVAVGRLAYVGGDSTVVSADISGLFAALTRPKTSGPMYATVGFRGIPGETVSGDVADSAAPVLIDTVRYNSGKAISETVSEQDTLLVTFSEPISSVITGNTPLTFSTPAGTQYTFPLNTATLTLVPGTTTTYKIVVTGGVAPDGVRFKTGDSVWINTAAAIKDAGGAVQSNPANRRVPLKVVLNPNWQIAISSNPFNPVNNVVSIPGVSGTGVAFTIKPMGRLGDISNLSEATATVYDALGNTIVEKTPFLKNQSSNFLYYVWNGCNKNNRLVGTGTYLAVISTTDLYGKQTKNPTRIGVKR